MGNKTFALPKSHVPGCVARSKRRATVALVLSSGALLAAVREGLMPLRVAPEPESVLLGLAFVVAFMGYLFVSVRCRRDREWIAPVLAACALGLAKGLFPNAAGPLVPGLRVLSVLLWLAATIISLGYVKSAFSHRADDGK